MKLSNYSPVRSDAIYLRITVREWTNIDHSGTWLSCRTQGSDNQQSRNNRRKLDLFLTGEENSVATEKHYNPIYSLLWMWHVEKHTQRRIFIKISLKLFEDKDQWHFIFSVLPK